MSDLVAYVEANSWYHGGVPGFSVGGALLPPDETGAVDGARYARQLAEEGQVTMEAASKIRTDRVYATVDRAAAQLFASLCPPAGGGSVYLVAPVWPYEWDADCRIPDYSIQAAKLIVLGVVETGVAAPTAAQLAALADRPSVAVEPADVRGGTRAERRRQERQR